MSLSEKAKDLAAAVQETDEFKALTSAQTRVKLDPAASELIQELQSAQQQLETAQQQGEQISPEQVQQFQQLEQQARANLTITNLLKAQQAFGEVMNQINQQIADALFDR